MSNSVAKNRILQCMQSNMGNKLTNELASGIASAMVQVLDQALAEQETALRKEFKEAMEIPQQG